MKIVGGATFGVGLSISRYFMKHLKQKQHLTSETRWRQPRLRITSQDDRESHASWIELFFDLVFAAVVSVLSQSLKQNLTLAGVFEFVALFVPCWWIWVLFTFYIDRYDGDDVLYRLFILSGMLAIIFLAVNSRTALRGSALGFALSYVLARSVVLSLYIRAARHVQAAHANLRLYLASYVPSTGLWLLSLSLAAPGRYYVWAGAMTIELLAPIMGSRLLAGTPVHPSHLPERLGLCTLIVMGESIVSVATGTAASHWALNAVLMAVGGFAIAACLWWLYFSFLETSVIIRGIRSVHLYNYGHLPILVGLILVAAGTQHGIGEANQAALPLATRWALCGGLVLYLTAIAAIRFTACRSSSIGHPWLSVASLAIPISLAIAGDSLPPLALVGCLLTVLVVKVSLEVWQSQQAVQRD